MGIEVRRLVLVADGRNPSLRLGGSAKARPRHRHQKDCTVVGGENVERKEKNMREWIRKKKVQPHLISMKETSDEEHVIVLVPF